MNLREKYGKQLEEIGAFDHLGQRIGLGGEMIGATQSVYVIAEAANNHMCNMDYAKEMVIQAIAAGANAIKFQTYLAKKLVRKDAKLYWEGKETSQLEYYARLEKFGAAEYAELFAFAKSKGITPFSTPFDLDSATMLNELGVDLFKIASCDLPDHRLLKHIASFGKPIILSTGASHPEEIDSAIDAIYSIGNFELVVMACTLSYPTPFASAHLRRIQSLKARYPWMIIGLSDHTEPDQNMVIPAIAVGLGAQVIEKHYTLDRTWTGSGHFFSVNPSNLKTMIDNIRLAETVLGEPELGVCQQEVKARESARRSIVANVFIPKGTRITSDMLGMKRPAEGLPGSMIDNIIGKMTTTDILEDQPISLSMIR